jgi:hypothetical protein
MGSIGAQALVRIAFSAWFKTGLVLLDSCNPEQRCNAASGLQPLKPGKLASVLLLFESKKSKSRPESLVHPSKPLLV